MKTESDQFTVSVHLECSDLFILAHFNVACLNEAIDMVGSEITVRLEDRKAWLWRNNRKVRELWFDDGYEGEDQCGKWLPNASRKSQNDYIDALLSYGRFILLCRPDSCFVPTWMCVVRYEYDAMDEFKEIHPLSWEDIYRTGMDQRYSALYAHTNATSRI